MHLESQKLDSTKKIQVEQKMKKYKADLEEAKRRLSRFDERKPDPEMGAELEDYVRILNLEER